MTITTSSDLQQRSFARRTGWAKLKTFTKLKCITENFPISHPKCLHNIWIPEFNLNSPNLSKPTQPSQLRIDSNLLSFGDCHSCADNFHWSETHGSTKASWVFLLHGLVNLIISRTNFPVVLASSCSGDKCQLGISLHMEPGGFIRAWGLFVDERLLA